MRLRRRAAACPQQKLGNSHGQRGYRLQGRHPSDPGNRRSQASEYGISANRTGAAHGQLMEEAEFRAIVEPLGRRLEQRTTLDGRTRTQPAPVPS